MKTYTIKYDTKDKGINGEFTRALPTLDDVIAEVSKLYHEGVATIPQDEPDKVADRTQACLESAMGIVLKSYYWGWFRQLLVSYRAQAKRLREGNKTDAAMSAGEVAAFMATAKLPVYGEPSEVKTDLQKAAEALEGLNPAQIAALLAKYGITEVKANG